MKMNKNPVRPKPPPKPPNLSLKENRVVQGKSKITNDFTTKQVGRIIKDLRMTSFRRLNTTATRQMMTFLRKFNVTSSDFKFP